MRAAWAIQGIGVLIFLLAFWYILEHQNTSPPPVPGTSTTSTLTSTNPQDTMQHAIMKIRSPAFGHEERIPAKYTCDSEDVSPPIAIDDAPEGTVSLALIVDDPDAPKGTWNHWLIWNIPGDLTRIGEGEEPEGVIGTNSWGRTDYGGPCPPNGEHRYMFKVYALDTMLDLEQGAKRAALLAAMEGHVLESTTLMGRYDRTAQ